MLTPAEISAPLIADLKADATLVTAVGAEIREDQWQGDDFVYPSVRVGGNQYPLHPTDGNCFGQWINISLSIFVFTEGLSSLLNQQIMGMVGEALQGSQLNTAALSSLALRVDYVPPIAFIFHAWRGEVLISGRVKEKV